MRAFLGLSSKLGDRIAHLQRAVQATPDLVTVSPVYQQGPSLVIVVELDTTSTPRRLLRIGRELERQARRVSPGPRPLSVDILWIDGLTVAEDDLTVPPNRLHEHDVVMRPLLDLAPDLEVPGWNPAAGGLEALGDLSELDLAPVAG